MKRARFGGMIVAIVTALIVYGAYQFGMKRGMTMTAVAPASSGTNATAQSSERNVLYWHDPMVPGRRFDKPGKSPFMDMQLVPVYADAAQGSGVSVSPEMTQNLGIRTATVRRGVAQSSIEAVGTVMQNERATVVVQSRATGYVERLFVRATLDSVARGQPLVTIFVPDWSGALTEYLGLRNANIDAGIVSAARERLRLMSIPDDIVTRSERDGIAQSRFTLTAPTSGVIAELGVREGVMVQPGMALFRIADLSSVWIEANIPEAQAAAVRGGAQAEAKSDAYPGRTFVGKVDAVLPQLDVATRTLRARVEVRNPQTTLKPGMFVSVTFKTSADEPVLLVPQEAVIATGKRNVVIVAGEDNRFAPVDVTLGRPAGADVEVKKGLVEGQRVVTSGQFLIDSEASLKSTLSRLESAAPASASISASSGAYQGEGRVEKVGSEEVTLSHEPIPALKWPSMTMGFKAPATGLPKDVKAGDRVRFEFVESDGAYRLTRIERSQGGK
ncbi:MAG TPA: efflux RND transporter periplasmic adaptor subunit [Casimicrobiaceae bacterium]|nr:efflux RND transporter periplasmic adaptor subunit [Casimicrobiaceae bacterium]